MGFAAFAFSWFIVHFNSQLDRAAFPLVSYPENAIKALLCKNCGSKAIPLQLL